MHHVYTISGHNSNSVYIGYCPDDGKSPLDHFLVGAIRPDDRADVRFVQEHDGDKNSLVWTILESVDTEWEAHTLRNEHRSTHPHSYTGPTHWPLGVHERAMKEDPQRITAANDRWTARACKTARDAYAKGLWTKEQIKQFADTHGRLKVVADLDQLTPNQFMVQYELQAA